jgi:hypothetical protein
MLRLQVDLRLFGLHIPYSKGTHSVVAEVTLDGSSTTDFGIDVYVIAGLSTVTDLLKVQGAYTATLVGSIGGIE